MARFSLPPSLSFLDEWSEEKPRWQINPLIDISPPHAPFRDEKGDAAAATGYFKGRNNFTDPQHLFKYSAEHVHPKFAQHITFHSPCFWRHGGPPVASPVKWTAAASRRRRLVNRRRIPPERRRRASWRHEQRLMRAARRSLGLISAFLHNEIAHSAATATDPVSLSFNGSRLAWHLYPLSAKNDSDTVTGSPKILQCGKIESQIKASYVAQ